MSGPQPSLTELGLVRPASSYRFDAQLVNGQWWHGNGQEVLPIHDAGTEREMGQARSATVEQVEAAVRAAHEALPGWRSTSAFDRAAALRRLQSELIGRRAELASVIAAEVGTVARMSLAIQVDSAIDVIGMTAEALLAERLSERVGNSTVHWRAVGVVAAITPWNYPLFQTIGKVAAALAAGCTVVHKPSELAPISAFILAEAILAAGFPAGVFNMVVGQGPTLGEQLAEHPLVDMVSFTGSTAAGRRVYSLAAHGVKRVALELGGKSAAVVLDDADLEQAIRKTVNRAFLNSGQTCDAWTRLLVPRCQAGEAVEIACDVARQLTLGDQFDEGARLGPLISARQRNRVRHYVDGAIAAGATAVLGGSDRPVGFDRGHFFRPTILTEVTPDMPAAREEIFGPVLCVLVYDCEDEAIAVSNATEYGLSGAVWSADYDRALRFAAQMDAGQVVINGGRFNPLAPFGGLKRSGVGRELGGYGIREFWETKAVQF